MLKTIENLVISLSHEEYSVLQRILARMRPYTTEPAEPVRRPPPPPPPRRARG